MDSKELQKKLLKNAQKTFKTPGIEINIIFDNNEIYDFLKKYKKFEKDSRKVTIRSK